MGELTATEWGLVILVVLLWAVAGTALFFDRRKRQRAARRDFIAERLRRARPGLNAWVGNPCRDPGASLAALRWAEEWADSWKASLVSFVDAQLGPTWAERVQATQSKISSNHLRDHLRDAYMRHGQLLDRMIHGLESGEITPRKKIRPSGKRYPKTGFCRHIPPPRVVAETEIEEYLRGKRELED